MSGDYMILAGLIFGAAVLYSSVGHAGASGYLAAMALFGLAPETMRPTALILNILVASLATWRYARAGQTDWRLLAPFAIASIPAAFVGGFIDVPPDIYRPLVGLALIAAAINMVVRYRKAVQDDAQAARPHLAVALLAGAGLGLLAGLTGTGGGVFLSPLILILGWATTRASSGVAAAFILANSVSGLAGFTQSAMAKGGLASIDLPSALPLWAAAAVIGGMIGTQLGTRILPVPGIRLALAAVLGVASLKLILS